MTSTTDAVLFEENTYNLLKSGDGWFGEHFEGALTTTEYSLPLENRIVSEPVELRTAYVATSKSGASGLQVNINGALVDDIPASNISGGYTVASNQVSEV